VILLVEKLETDRKHFRLIEQLESCLTSVAMNIAEGKGRYSQKEFIHFLYIARGSLFETITLMEIFKRMKWITEKHYCDVEMHGEEIVKMLNSLILKLIKSS
jgi:four helix bundle protein